MKKTTQQFQLEDTLVELLEKIAKRNKRSKAAQIELYVEESLYNEPRDINYGKQ